MLNENHNKQEKHHLLLAMNHESKKQYGVTKSKKKVRCVDHKLQSGHPQKTLGRVAADDVAKSIMMGSYGSLPSTINPGDPSKIK